ncbi:NAD(P)-dependent oxidoreductase [Candidatus Mycobacterium wuenschmannii]|uniref:NAD(P)-dependent oxidoreductase n=1 Tax=Candidatus Mycobacterium wuenschmannii TaxID=3027808 RepID=A0ABY8W6F7_9MYCO|nr:NAD(P)-dependent oxidoreductase [Candidatus Mycobacterium wuenschmannii]WIM90037.1 NAD(P)-dependent oxidoreductase [Candidatus Mycobacterium wuenschmannii]
MAQTVLVTGAFGLVGSETVRQLTVEGRHVVATDLDVPANRKAAAAMPSTEVRWADLTDPQAVSELLQAVSPSAIIHLAAIIPPVCYARPELARRVNIDATGLLIDTAAALPNPPRFIQASSVAAYGARNPHRINDVLTADTPLRPSDIYGTHKVEAEKLVRASSLDWVILRLGGVLTAEPRLDVDLDTIFFEGSLPIDGRIQTVDVRDVARAFIAATTAPVVGETLLIGGDDSHRLVQGDIAPSTAAAMGLAGGIPTGRKGDPDHDGNWFATDWMDTSRSANALDFQRISWPQLLAETATRMGWRRHPARVIAPLTRALLKRRSPYHRYPGHYADPWGVIDAKWEGHL